MHEFPAREYLLTYLLTYLLRCLLCMKGDERVGFFVLTLKVDRLSDHQIMIVVVLHHHAFSTM